MKSEHLDEWGLRIKTVFSVLDKKPKERLDFIATLFQIKNAVNATLMLLDPLADAEYAHTYDLEALETLHKYLVDSATILRDMLWYFHAKSQRDRERHSLAV